MSGVDDMMRRRQQNQRGAPRKPPPRHPRPERAEETPKPDESADANAGGAGAQGTQNSPEVTAESVQAHGGGSQTEQQADTGEKTGQAPAAEPKAKPAAKKPPARAAKRVDADKPDQGSEHGAVVALRGEAERKQVEIAALEWAAAARKLGEKDAKLRVAVDAATTAGTPPELIVAALVQAEGRSGHKVPDQVRSLAERRKTAP